jgi:tight adherence protein B
VLRACESPALRQLAVGWQVSQRTGIRLAPVAGKIAATVRADAERHRELRASLAGARSSARLVASLPVAGMLLGATVGANPHQVLFATRSGLMCLVAGVLLDLVGLGWTNRIADAAVSSRAEPLQLGAASRPDARPRRPRTETRTRSTVAVGCALGLSVAGTAVAAEEFGAAAGLASVAATAGWLFTALRRAATADPTPQLFADLPVALDLTAACLAAGTPPEVAHRVVGHAVGGPLGSALVAAAHRASRGSPAGEAFVDLVEVSQPRRSAVFGRHRAGPLGPAVVAVTSAFERSGDSGARLATTLERVAERLRGCAHVEAVEAVRRAGVLAVAPLGLCFLPAFILLGVVPVVLATAHGLLGDLSPAAGPP